MLKLVILVLTAQWVLTFFGRSLINGIPHTNLFMYVLSFAIVILIFIGFVS